MKHKRALEIDRRANFRASSEKLNFSKHLVGFWRDLEDNQRWEYDPLSPVPCSIAGKPENELAPGNTVDNNEALRTNIVLQCPRLPAPDIDGAFCRN